MMYYNWRYIDSFNAPITVVVAKRGVGKTFGRVLKAIRRFESKGSRFIYGVETDEMIAELTQNKGEKFFAKIFEYLQNSKSKRNQKLYDFLTGQKTELEENESIFGNYHKIRGSTIIMNGRTAGYLVSLNGFAKLKRNNFVGIHDIILDEFIPETIDIRSLKNTYKLVSIIQSIARTQTDVRVYLLGNSIRLNDDILIKLGLKNLKKGEIRRIYDKYGLFVVCEYVDDSKYQEFKEIADKSVAGRLATLTGEDSLETNTFKDDLPESLQMPSKLMSSHLIFCLHGQAGSVRVHVTKDYSTFYILEDYGTNTRNRVCIDLKFATDVVKYMPEYKEYMLSKFVGGRCRFENSYILMIFKSILKLDTNS